MSSIGKWIIENAIWNNGYLEVDLSKAPYIDYTLYASMALRLDIRVRKV